MNIINIPSLLYMYNIQCYQVCKPLNVSEITQNRRKRQTRLVIHHKHSFYFQFTLVIIAQLNSEFLYKQFHKLRILKYWEHYFCLEYLHQILSWRSNAFHTKRTANILLIISHDVYHVFKLGRVPDKPEHFIYFVLFQSVQIVYDNDDRHVLWYTVFYFFSCIFQTQTISVFHQLGHLCQRTINIHIND